MKLAINKGSKVKVIAGAQKGQEGVVLDVDKVNLRIRVQGVRVQTKHSGKDGLVKTEGYNYYSNVKLVEKAAAKKAEKKAKSKSKAKSA